jgi:hypothetical protein
MRQGRYYGKNFSKLPSQIPPGEQRVRRKPPINE